MGGDSTFDHRVDGFDLPGRTNVANYHSQHHDSFTGMQVFCRARSGVFLRGLCPPNFEKRLPTLPTLFSSDFHPVLPTQPPKLILECFSLMMVFLIGNVLFERST